MNFILSVFGANVVIVCSIFFYVYMMFLLYKCVFNKYYVEWKEYGFESTYWIEAVFICFHLPYCLFWPLAIIIHILYIIIANFVPVTFKFFDKITPSIKIEKEKE